MNDQYAKLESVLASSGLDEHCEVSLKHNPSGLPSAWLLLQRKDDIVGLLESLRSIGTRMATMTVYRPDAAALPDTHGVSYHMVLEGMPITISLRLDKDDFLPSAARLFPHLDWEERELMELSGVEVRGLPNPRRLLLDESIEAGVFDRLVPFSEMTNAMDGDAVWARIREYGDAAAARRQAQPDSFGRREK
jgi:NADH:ubiquinone oxidoreductase subunit C